MNNRGDLARGVFDKPDLALVEVRQSVLGGIGERLKFSRLDAKVKIENVVSHECDLFL